MKIIKEPWIDYRGNETESLCLDTGEEYTISELIALLQAAEKEFGDKKIDIYNMSDNSLRGFSRICLNHNYDEREKYGHDCYDEGTVSICVL